MDVQVCSWSSSVLITLGNQNDIPNIMGMLGIVTIVTPSRRILNGFLSQSSTLSDKITD